MKRNWSDRVLGITCLTALCAVYLLATTPRQAVYAGPVEQEEVLQWIGRNKVNDPMKVLAFIVLLAARQADGYTTMSDAAKFAGTLELLEAVTTKSAGISVSSMAAHLGPGMQKELRPIWNRLAEEKREAEEAAAASNELGAKDAF